MTHRLKWGIALSVVAAMALAGCSATGGSSSSSSSSSGSKATSDQGNITALEAAAKKEGSLVWYTEQPPALDDQTVAAFKAQFGINVQYVALNSGPLAQRYEAEAQSGSVAADVITLSASTDFMNQMVSKGYGMDLSAAKLPVFDLNTYPKAYEQPTANGKGFVSATIGIGAFQILYDTKTISGSMVPKTFKDLTASKYKGLLTLPDPSSSATIMSFFVNMDKKYGDSVLSGIAANKPQFYNTVSAAGQAMVAGAGGITVPALPAVVAALKSSGAPVEGITPPITSGPAFNVMLTATKKSPHPNAGKLFANWLLSDSGQNSSQGSIGITVYSPSIPKGYTPATLPTSAESANVLKLLGRPAAG